MHQPAQRALAPPPYGPDLPTPSTGTGLLLALAAPHAHERLAADPTLATILRDADDRLSDGDVDGALDQLARAERSYVDHEHLGPAAVTATVAGLIAQENGRLATARRFFGTAASNADRTGDPVTFAVAVLGLGGIWVHEHRSKLERARVRALQREALARLNPTEPLARRLRLRLLAESAYVGSPADRQRIVAEARRLTDPAERAFALSLAHHCLLDPDHGTDRRALAEELMGVSALTGRPLDALVGLTWTAVDLFLAGHPHAERSLGELEVRASAARIDSIRFVVSAMRTMLAIRAGRLVEAEELAASTRQLGAEAGDADADGWHLAHLVTIRWMQGRGAELLTELSDLTRSASLADPNESFLAGVAALSASSGMHAPARAALQRIRGTRGLRHLSRSSTWLVTLLGVIEAAHALGDVAVAREAYELLAPFADLPVMGSLAVTCLGSAQRPLGMAALTAGDVESAVLHLEAAVDGDLRLGNLPGHAISCAALAEALSARGDGGDRERAASLLGTAIEAGTRFGLTGRLSGWERAALEARGSTADTDEPIGIRRTGRAWLVTLGTRSVEVPHAIGLAYLAMLARNPGLELSAAELAGGSAIASELNRQPVLDERARQQYRQRIDELRTEIADADRSGHHEGAAKARIELDWLLEELAKATGLAGRVREFDDGLERARTSVQKAIKRALRSIENADPAVGAALKQRVVTGSRCVFLGSTDLA